MAETALLVAKGLFALAGVAAAVKLAQQAREARGLPTHALVSAMIFVGGFGLVMFGAAPALAPRSPNAALWGLRIGDLLERVALLGLCGFVWRVFRRSDPVGVVVALLCAGCLIYDGALAWRSANPSAPHTGPDMWRGQLVFALPFVWSAIETRLYYQRLRLQLALGLVTPVVCNRLLIWCIACAAFASICPLAIASDAAQRAGLDGLAAALIGLRAAVHAGLVVPVWLGLYPPRAYLGWIERRAVLAEAV